MLVNEKANACTCKICCKPTCIFKYKIVNISQYLPRKAGKSIIFSVVYASDELCSLHGDLEEYDVSGRK